MSSRLRDRVCAVTKGDFPMASHPELQKLDTGQRWWSIDRIDLLRCSDLCNKYSVWMIFKSVTLKGTLQREAEEELCVCKFVNAV